MNNRKYNGTETGRWSSPKLHGKVVEMDLAELELKIASQLTNKNNLINNEPVFSYGDFKRHYRRQLIIRALRYVSIISTIGAIILIL